MREIRFRGKDLKTGEWRYGYYAVHHIPKFDDYGKRYVGYEIRHGIFNDEEGARTKGGYWKTVDENTVGQFTGWKDKNGKEIYVGDIIECESRRYVCEFIEGGFEFRDLSDGELILKAILILSHVIGNIHDNPELKNINV